MKKFYSEMTVNELRHIAAKAENRINATHAKIQEAGLYSPALKHYEKTRIAKPISRMNRGELYNTIYRQNDLKYKQTSTYKGTYQYINDTRKTLRSDYSLSAKNRQVSKLFEIYDDVTDNDPKAKTYKYETLQDINTKLKNNVTIDTVLNNAEEIKKDSYEKKETNLFNDFNDL